MVCRAEFRGGISNLKRGILSSHVSQTGKSQVEFCYEILIEILRRDLKVKFRDLNLDQGKIPRFKISRRLMSYFVAPLLHLRAENLRDAGNLLARNVKFCRFDLYAVERAKRGFG